MKIITVTSILFLFIFYFNISDSEYYERKEKRLKLIWEYNNVKKERYLTEYRSDKRWRIMTSIWVTDSDWFNPMKRDSIYKFFNANKIEPINIHNLD